MKMQFDGWREIAATGTNGRRIWVNDTLGFWVHRYYDERWSNPGSWCIRSGVPDGTIGGGNTLKEAITDWVTSKLIT